MCYSLLLSTTADEDLSTRNGELVRFERDLPDIADVAKLSYTNCWHVGSEVGCSCSFRHLYSVELGFGEPVDWYPEEEDDIEATIQFIAIIREPVRSGHQVDCIDVWAHQDKHPIAKAVLEVDLTKMSDREFRFFENYHFEFKYTIECPVEPDG
jgi:hypothetical protein